jgi:deazaflavin-dependent oxidoreductase (nitroreductase family)
MRTREGRFSRPLAAFTRFKAGSWTTKKLYFPIDRALYRLTGGRRGLSPPKATLNLTTTGAKTGLPRSVPVLYLRDGSTFWVMASNFGGQKHPAWSSNLLKHPEAKIQILDETLPVRARLASEDEKQQLRPRLIELYPSWEQYETWTDRNFRLFALEVITNPSS